MGISRLSEKIDSEERKLDPEWRSEFELKYIEGLKYAQDNAAWLLGVLDGIKELQNLDE